MFSSKVNLKWWDIKAWHMEQLMNCRTFDFMDISSNIYPSYPLVTAKLPETKILLFLRIFYRQS